LGALDNLYEINTSVLAEQKVANYSIAARKADDQAKAKALQNALLGLLTPSNKLHYLVTRKNTAGGSSCRSATCPSGSNSNARSVSSITEDDSASSSEMTKKKAKPTSDVQTLIDLTPACLAEQTSIMLAKEERKRDQQEIKAKERERQLKFKVHEVPE
jgi:hypothetical protein